MRRRRRIWLALALLPWGLPGTGAVACAGEAGAPAAARTAEARAPALAPRDSLSDSLFASLHARLSEEGGYFDTDNLISNESGYLNVVGALERLGLRGGAYAGVGPDQNYSYLAQLRPEVAFVVDVRRDNALQHLLLKALVERSSTRVEFLSALHARTPPADADAWRDATVQEVVEWVDGAPPRSGAELRALQQVVEEAVRHMGIPLTETDLATVARFHRAFIDDGLDLRFTSHGRRPQPYYPTYRQLVLETDAEGDPASWLVSDERYQVVRDLHRANRIIPVVGDLAGASAVREMGRVLREMELELTAFYVSNVEFYLWGDGLFDAWTANLAALPAAPDAVLIRSYFPRLAGRHPAAIPGYYATQMLQPVRTVVEASEGRPFQGYGDLVTRDLIPLQGPVDGG